MSIKFYNLKEQFEDQKLNILGAINFVAASGQYFAEDYVKRFENLVSGLYDGGSCASCNSGTSALIVALKIADLPKNSRVLIPAMTYVATANAVVAAGLVPVCVDIDNYWLMDYKQMAFHLEHLQYVSAVIVVDLYGQGVDLPKYRALCDHYQVKLIVDAAQSFDLKYDAYHQIDYCDSIALSFNPLKNLGALGNAGAVVSKNYTVEQLKKYTHQGKQDGDVVTPGVNLRMDAVQAAVLLTKYERWDDIMQRKFVISGFYRQQLEGLVEMPDRVMYATPTNYVFEIAPSAEQLEAIKFALSVRDIEYTSHYEKPIHHYSAYQSSVDLCPRATALAGRCLSLPNHWHMSNDDVMQVIDAVKSVV
jgi:UDP-2-acetamido-2-deoxy-ribo-hexuluronate aminotransferase